MSDRHPAVSEVQPWPARAARRVSHGARNGWLGLTGWLSGWGVGGTLVALLVAGVLGYVGIAAYGSHHPSRTPCDQASGLVGRIQTMQSDERRVTLDGDMVRDLHRIGARLTPIADHAYGSAKDPLTRLATLASNARVGDHLQAQNELDLVDNACPRP
jgi:hypothetical protein